MGFIRNFSRRFVDREDMENLIANQEIIVRKRKSQSNCYHSRLPNPLPIVKCQLHLSLVTQVSCSGSSRSGRVAAFNLCPLMADDTGNDLIVPRNRLANG